jgi:hypothetical protein
MPHPLAQLAFRISAIVAVVGITGAVVSAGVGLVLFAVLPSGTATAETLVCGKTDVVPSGGQDYLARNAVRDNTEQCITAGDQSLRIERAEHDAPPGGPPAASPALLKGCHDETCSKDSGLPVLVSRMPEVTSDLVTTQAVSGTYYAGHTVFFHTKAEVESEPDGAEMTIWLRDQGGVRPPGLMIASAIPIAGAGWNVWFGQADGLNRIAYERVGDVTSVKGLDIRAFTKDSVVRGLVKPEWYLVGVEAGFTVWRGGAGNAVEHFEVSVSGEPPGACSARLAVDETWSSGFTATVVVTNSGESPVRGWAVDWTFPGEQVVKNWWDADITQTGKAVNAVNADYNGTLPAAGSTTFGLVGDGPPPVGAELTCVPR